MNSEFYQRLRPNKFYTSSFKLNDFPMAPLGVLRGDCWAWSTLEHLCFQNCHNAQTRVEVNLWSTLYTPYLKWSTTSVQLKHLHINSHVLIQIHTVLPNSIHMFLKMVTMEKEKHILIVEMLCCLSLRFSIEHLLHLLQNEEVYYLMNTV